MSVILNNKAQLKIQQMVFLLLAITLFFILVGLFFIGFKVATLQKDVVELKKDRAVGLVEKISGNPEFVFDGKSNAIDADKLMILKNEQEYIFLEDGRRKTLWGVNGVIVRKLYPSDLSLNPVECTQETYPNCDIIKIFTTKSSTPISSFVSLCTKKRFQGVNYDHCELAELMIEEEGLND